MFSPPSLAKMCNLKDPSRQFRRVVFHMKQLRVICFYALFPDSGVPILGIWVLLFFYFFFLFLSLGFKHEEFIVTTHN